MSITLKSICNDDDGDNHHIDVFSKIKVFWMCPKQMIQKIIPKHYNKIYTHTHIQILPYSTLLCTKRCATVMTNQKLPLLVVRIQKHQVTIKQPVIMKTIFAASDREKFVENQQKNYIHREKKREKEPERMNMEDKWKGEWVKIKKNN